MEHRRPLSSSAGKETAKKPRAFSARKGVAALLLVGAAAWFGRESRGARPPEPTRGAPSALLDDAPRTETAVHIAPPEVEAKVAVPARVETEDVIAGPRNENLVPGAKPHPVTPAHLYIHGEVHLIESAWTALERRDFAKARELVEEHHAAYAGRNDDLDEGISLLADCMEYPSEDTRSRAQRFYDEETYSTARRRIRRWCLDM